MPSCDCQKKLLNISPTIKEISILADVVFAVEPILEIDSTIGHTIGDSLKEALEEEVNK